MCAENTAENTKRFANCLLQPKIHISLQNDGFHFTLFFLLVQNTFNQRKYFSLKLMSITLKEHVLLCICMQVITKKSSGYMCFLPIY